MIEHPRSGRGELGKPGAVVVGAPRSQSVGELVVHTFVFACIFGVLFLLFSLMSGWQTHGHLGPFALPLVLGFGISTVPLIYRAVLSRHSFPLAVVVAALAIGIYSVGAGATLTALAQLPITDVGVLWHLAGAALWGLLAAMVGAFWPGAVDSAKRRRPIGVDPNLSDEKWETQTAAHLRARGDMTDAYVRDILSEAREHASAGGGRLVSTFGAPSQYARRPAPQRGVAARRQALLYTAITVVPLWHLVRHVLGEGWTWDAGLAWAGLWLIAAATAAAFAWRTSLQRR